jgi:hypothetical protein
MARQRSKLLEAISSSLVCLDNLWGDVEVIGANKRGGKRRQRTSVLGRRLILSIERKHMQPLALQLLGGWSCLHRRSNQSECSLKVRLVVGAHFNHRDCLSGNQRRETFADQLLAHGDVLGRKVRGLLAP